MSVGVDDAWRRGEGASFWIQKVFVSFGSFWIQKVFVSFGSKGFRIFWIQKVFVSFLPAISPLTSDSGSRRDGQESEYFKLFHQLSPVSLARARSASCSCLRHSLSSSLSTPQRETRADEHNDKISDIQSSIPPSDQSPRLTGQNKTHQEHWGHTDR